MGGYGVTAAREVLLDGPESVAAAADELGYPVVLKLCGDAIAHKTERDLVRLGLGDAKAVARAAEELWSKRRPEDGDVKLLLAEQVSGRLELIAGMVRDPQFGPCVLLGLGGVLTEALGDAVFATAPLSRDEAHAMQARLRASHLLSEPFRGDPAVDSDALAEILVGLGKLALDRPDVASVDLNPLLVHDGKPIAVDALVELHEGVPPAQVSERPLPDGETLRERFAALFEPRGIVVAGVSSHPGKFGFVAYHNLRRMGFQGELFPVNRDGAEILGESTYRDVSEVPEGRADLVFVCTPSKVNVELLRACKKIGVRAAFVASGGYGEAGPDGKEMENELVEVADELDMLVAGPNGQGVINTARSMCAQIVAPYPPAGKIAVVSQSGNLVSSFLNYASLTGVGVSKACSCGNSTQTELADFLAYFAEDSETAVVLAYVEGVPSGGRFIEALKRLTAKKPLVLVRGGVASEGKRAAASHTGSLASDDRIFDGICRQYRVLRAPTVEEAFEWAASFATQPLPRGKRTVVVTTAGGWGVLAADACAAAGLQLVWLPDDLRAEIDKRLPPRWSRNNPIDFAGGETRDTVPEVLDLVCAHPEVDAVIHLGIGIQAGQANLFRTGEFYPEHGLERISDYHERQDARYATAAKEASERHRKPVMTCTELVYTDRAYGNAGPLAVQEAGRLCYPSAHRAVSALRAMCEFSEASVKNV